MEVVLALYSRFETHKILALLTPRRRQVTYTKAGLSVLGLHKSHLPEYADLVARIAAEATLFVVLPYQKGRTEEEMLALLSAAVVVDTSLVRDLEVALVAKQKGLTGTLACSCRTRTSRLVCCVGTCKVYNHYKP